MKKNGLSIALSVFFLVGSLLGIFLLKDGRIYIPSLFFFGYFFREVAFRSP
jgi:hypothetical protein